MSSDNQSSNPVQTDSPFSSVSSDVGEPCSSNTPSIQDLETQSDLIPTRSTSITRKGHQSHSNHLIIPPKHRPLSIRSDISEDSYVPSPGHDSSLSLNPPAPIYPALLSTVAVQFRNRIMLQTHTKDSLEYKACFMGSSAVDLLSDIIKTTDRNLALLLGRTLDAQKYIHDVTYSHRLRDSPYELYVFSEAATDDSNLPNGVFTILSDCYSPTCSRESLCYSITCPRRLEQQTRLSTTTAAALKSSSIVDLFVEEEPCEEKLWVDTVPKSVVENISKDERKRQEVIFELISTEKEFCQDLQLINELYIQSLYNSTIIEQPRVSTFVKQVFGNILQIHSVNTMLLESLLRRQKQDAVVSSIGDIFFNVAMHFVAYIEYGANQVYGKHYLEQELSENIRLKEFLHQCERLPKTRKLPIQSFLARPTTRLGRYPLLLGTILKYTADDHPDKTMIPAALEQIKHTLSRINEEAGKADNALRLAQINQNLVFKNGEHQELGLLEPSRVLVRDGTLRIKNGSDLTELQIFLFDHCLLLTKKKLGKNVTKYKVYRKAIPLELLAILPEEEVQANKPSSRHETSSPGSQSGNGATLKLRGLGNQIAHIRPLHKRPSFGESSHSSHSLNSPLTPNKVIGNQFVSHPTLLFGAQQTPQNAIHLLHMGKNGGSYTLFASSVAEHKLWLEKIEAQLEAVTNKQKVFTTKKMSSAFFSTFGNRVNSEVILPDKRLLIGTETGLFIGENEYFVQLLQIDRVKQIDILSEYQVILVLADRILYSYPTSILTEPSSSIKPNRISSYVSFFKVGVCYGKTLVCVVKSSSLQTRIKIFEPLAVGASRITMKMLLKNNGMKLYKELYIPSDSTSIFFLKTKLCVGCAMGFEIVDLESLRTRGLLDQNDPSLEFVTKPKRDNLRPIAIFKVKSGDYLLCYNEFAFYVDKSGHRGRGEWAIHWEGVPTSFAYSHPYVLAADPTFLEIRHVETGQFIQAIPAKDLRCLNDSNELSIHCVRKANFDFQEIFAVELIPPT